MAHLSSRHRLDVGRFGEAVAACFLEGRGLTVIDRNMYVNGDEIDLMLLEGSQRIAVEVKTSTNGDDPMDAIDDVKVQRVRRAVQAYGAPVHRIDAVAVQVTTAGVSVRWLKGVM